VIGHPGKSDGAQENRIVPCDQVKAVLRHHPARLPVGFAAPVEMVPLELDAEAPPGALQYPEALRHDLLADPVAGNNGDSMSDHVSAPRVHSPASRFM
jgi:hypothetical protein